MEKFEVGGYAYYSWGYGQTNIDWFKVVKRNDKSVWLESVKGVRSYDGDMHGQSVPSDEVETYIVGLEEVDGQWRNKFEQLKMRKKIHAGYKGECASGDYGNIYPWDGKPKFFSEWN